MASSSLFFSPYSVEEPYWIILNAPDAVLLAEVGGKPLYHNAELYGVTVKDWSAAWNALAAEHLAEMRAAHMNVAVISAVGMPSMQEIELSYRTVDEIDTIAKSLWLADYLNDQRLICFVQRVVDRKKKEVGYEAFARIEAPDGSIIGGGAIMQASHTLHMEYQVDRMMHKRAIESFVTSELEGMLFINFLTGFIHRPEVYLDGLNQAVDRHHVLPRAVVLDVSLPGYAKDMAKLESIAHYCRERGFSLALDDVTSPNGLANVLQLIRPAVVKLDAKLGGMMQDPQKQKLVEEIVALSHAAGASVLAEGVENDALYNAYLAIGVDMFQGYFFGAPEPCVTPAAKKQKKA